MARRWSAKDLAYYAVLCDADAGAAFRTQVRRNRLKVLRRRLLAHPPQLDMDAPPRNPVATSRRRAHPFPKCASPLAPEAGAQCRNPAAGTLHGRPPARQGGPYRDPVSRCFLIGDKPVPAAVTPAQIVTLNDPGNDRGDHQRQEPRSARQKRVSSGGVSRPARRCSLWSSRSERSPGCRRRPVWLRPREPAR